MPTARRRGTRFLAVAIFLALIAVAAVPALADNGTAGIPLPPPPPSDSGGGDGSAGSTSGYPNASEAQAENLFADHFSGTVDSLASDPPDLSGEHPDFLDNRTAVTSPAGPPAATVDQIQAALDRDAHDSDAAQADVSAILDQANSGDDDPARLVASTLPLRTPDASGQQAPVDLSLDQQGSSYEPQNPLVDLSLPDTITHEVAVGDQGLKVDVGATDPASADQIAGDNLFYADAAQATDVVLAPISTGLETLYELRAPSSPDHFQMTLTLPDGASLSPSGDGGAQVTRDGQTLAAIYPPNAQDAAGNPVPVSMTVAGHQLDLEVPHSDPGIQYPISVDPAIDTYTWSANGAGTFSDWIQNKTTGSPYQLKTTCTQSVNCTSGTTGPAGLYVAVPQNASVTAQSVGAWQYRVPHYGQTTGYISNLSLGPMYFANRGDTNANPFLFGGIYDDNGTYTASQGQTSNALNLYWSLDPGTLKTGKQGVFALWSWLNRQLTQWRDAYLGGATVTLGDRESPVLEDPTHSGITFESNGYSDWVDDATPTITAHATDKDPANANAGLGIKNFQFSIPYASGGADQTKQMGCTGANASPCPQSASSGPVSYDTSQMPNGVTVIGVVATDAMSNADVQIPAVRVDHARPRISLSGGLAPGGGSGGAYTLHIDATDGDASGSANWQSGVRQITLSVNGDPVTLSGAGPQNCTQIAGSCPLSVDYTLQPSDYTTPNLHFTVDATDELGHHALGAGGQSLDWSVPLPDTSIDSGPSGPTNDATPTFNYSSPDSGASFQCRVDQGAFAACSASGFTPSTALSEGSHTFEVRAVSDTGHLDSTAATRSFTVDTQAPTVSIDSGPSGLATNPRPIFGFSSVDGSATLTCSIDTGSPAFRACAANTSDQPLADLPTGSYTFRVKATDPAGNSTIATRAFQVADPQLNVSGPLVDGSDPLVGAEPVTDVYATDASAGFTSVMLLVDGEEEDGLTPDDLTSDCPAIGGCDLQDTLMPDLTDLAAGTHSYTIAVTDGNGQTKSVSGTFRLDPTPPELSVDGPLAASDGQTLATGTATANISATDQATGDSGISKIEVAIDADVARSDTPSCVPSCPAQTSTTYTYSKDPSGAGPHTVDITATDKAGNEQTTTLVVDAPPPKAAAQCPVASPTVQAAVDPVTPAQAAAGVASSAVAPSEPGWDPQTDGSVDPSVYRPDDSPPTPLESSGSLSSDDLASVPAGALNVDRVVCLTPTRTTTDETSATVVNGDAAVYANSGPDTDTVVRPTAVGETLIQSVRGDSAPNSYSWNVGLQDGDQLQSLSNGGIAIVDPSAPSPDVVQFDQAPPAEDPQQIPDVNTQLDNADYQMAAAEQETGMAVAAVIPAPYVMDAAGNRTGTASLNITGANKITVSGFSSDSTVMNVISKSSTLKPGHAECTTQNGLNTTFKNYVWSRLCVLRGKNGGNIRALWHGYIANDAYVYNIAARLYVKLKKGHNPNLARSHEFVNPTTPVTIRTPSVKPFTAQYCAILMEHAPDHSFKHAASPECFVFIRHL